MSLEEIRKNHPEHVDALEFMSSPRGFYILSQAIYIAIEVMSQFPSRDRPRSNIEDLQFLRDHLFNLPDEMVDPTAWGAANVASLYEEYIKAQLDGTDEWEALKKMKEDYRDGN